jgi:hypothetical protein
MVWPFKFCFKLVHNIAAKIIKKIMLLDLTDVCPLLAKQYIQVGLQIQYVLNNFLDGLSPHTW